MKNLPMNTASQKEVMGVTPGGPTTDTHGVGSPQGVPDYTAPFQTHGGMTASPKAEDPTQTRPAPPNIWNSWAAGTFKPYWMEGEDDQPNTALKPSDNIA